MSFSLGPWDDTGDYFGPYWVQVLLPTTIRSLVMDSNTQLQVTDATLLVSSATTWNLNYAGNPHPFFTRSPLLFVGRGTASLGDFEGQIEGAVNALDTPMQFVAQESLGQPGIIEWNDAVIEEFRNGSLYLEGMNSRIRNARGLAGNNALSGLRLIGAGATLILHQHHLTVSGGLEHHGNIYLRNGARLTIPGDLTGTGRVQHVSGAPTTLTVNGAVQRLNTVLELSPEPGSNSNGLNFEALGGFFLTNTTVRGSGRMTGNVTATGTTFDGDNGGQIEVTGNISNTGGCLNGQRTRTGVVDSFTLKAQTHLYSTTKSAGNWNLGGRVRWQDGSIHPGYSPGVFRVQDGNLELVGNVELGMEIGGRTPVTGHDVITQSGGPDGTTLAGTLKVTFIDRFECEVQTTDSFTILTSDRPLLGAFGNVASGARLSTTDGSGSFLVRYGAGSPVPNHVVLSDFQPVIVPETYAQWVARLAIPSGQTGPGDDPNGDGITNAIAFATGLSPVGPGEPSPFLSELTPAGVVVSFLAPKSALGLTVTSASSTDLSAWPVGPALTAVPYSALKNRYSFTLPLTGSDRRFGRFNITAAP